jgi:hypothetical protein
MARRNSKRPKAGNHPSVRKEPVAGAQVAPRKRPVPGPQGPLDKDACLLYGLSLMDEGGPWGWSGIAAEHLKRVVAKSKGWESMTIGELLRVSGNKPIPFDHLCPEAQRRLVELELDDYDGLWELRLGGKPRIWGVLSGHVFYPVWWDPKHTVCPSKKKGT